MITFDFIRRKIKRNRKGIFGGILFGAASVLYMKVTGIVTQAAVSPGGLIEKIVTLPSADMALLKLVITAIILGGFAGFIIQEKFIK